MSAVAESEFGNTASDRAFANNGDLWTMSQPVVFQFRNPQYVCPTHGDQGSMAAMDIRVERQAPNPLSIRRVYCMECWVAWMDAGMQQLTEKEPSR
jgi:hypothetical protein